MAAASLLATTPIAALDYGTARAEALRRCEGIDPSAYESGLLFNPDGYRSFYLRSQCVQEAAVQYRDALLCAQVRERRALLWSSWAISPAHCRQLVSEGVAADRRALEAMRRPYLAGGMTLRDFRIERNGNRRDFDIIPAFAGTYAHGYVLTVEILPSASARPIVIHSTGYYVDAKSNLRIYVTQADVRARFPAFALERPYDVRATLVLDVGMGGQAGYWSEPFIESVFPVRERSQSITRRAVF